MPTDYNTAFGDAMTMVKDAIATSAYPSLAIAWPNIQFDVPAARISTTDEPTPWAKVLWQSTSSDRSGVGNVAGQARYRSRGVLTIELRLAGNRGVSNNAALITILQTKFRRIRSPNGVLFSDPKPRDRGNDGPWFWTDVVVDYQYDEIR